MPAPTLDTETVVIGTLTHLTPRAARPHLDRLAPEDFVRWPARCAFTLLREMTADGMPSLDVATLVGYAQHTNTVPRHQWSCGLTRFLLDAVSADVPAPALDFHIDRLLEATYRRRYASAAARLAQVADTATLTDLDHHLTTITNDLRHHRTRITPPAAPVTGLPGRAA